MKAHKGLFITLLGLFVLTQWSSSLYLPIAPKIAIALEDHTGLIATSLSLFFAGYAIGQLLWGSLSDYIGCYPAQLAALILYLAFELLMPHAHSTIAFTSFLIVTGFTVSANTSAGNAMIKDIYGKQKSKMIIGYVGVAMACAPVVAPLIASHLYTLFGWKSIFYFLFSLGLILLVSFSYQFRDYHRHAIEHKAIMADGFFKRFKIILSNKVFLGFVTILSISFGAFFSVLLLLPYALSQIGHFSTIQIGYIIFGSTVTYIIGTLANVAVAAKRHPHEVVKFGLVLLIVSIVVVAINYLKHDSLISIADCIAVGVFMLGIGIIVPAAKSGAMTSQHQYIGAAAASMKFLQSLGAVVLTQVSSWYLNHHEFNQIIALLGTVTLLGIAIYFSLLRKVDIRG